MYETADLRVEQPWPGAGLRIIDKAFGRPYWPSGAFYGESALDDAKAAADRIQVDLDAGRVPHSHRAGSLDAMRSGSNAESAE
jgi:hypothetical protein